MGCSGSKKEPLLQPGSQASSGSGEGASKTDSEQGVIGGAKFTADSNRQIKDFYIYGLTAKKLGQGADSTVWKAKRTTTGKIRAVKSIPRSKMENLDRFHQEIAIMKQMDHPNIIRLFDVFEDQKNLYLIMQICEGGELFHRIISTGNFTEVQSAILMQQMLRSIYYMHSNHVCHRDIKPENFLFQTKDPIEQTVLKLIDFGLACASTPESVFKTKSGTPLYVAPQVLAGEYCQKCDLWSSGVIMYMLLCGLPPFPGDTPEDVLTKVCAGKFSFDQPEWNNVTEDAKNLIRMLLKMNPKFRCTAEEALKHEWIKKKAQRPTNVSIKST